MKHRPSDLVASPRGPQTLLVLRVPIGQVSYSHAGRVLHVDVVGKSGHAFGHEVARSGAVGEMEHFASKMSQSVMSQEGQLRGPKKVELFTRLETSSVEELKREWSTTPLKQKNESIREYAPTPPPLTFPALSDSPCCCWQGLPRRRKPLSARRYPAENSSKLPSPARRHGLDPAAENTNICYEKNKRLFGLEGIVRLLDWDGAIGDNLERIGDRAQGTGGRG